MFIELVIYPSIELHSQFYIFPCNLLYSLKCIGAVHLYYDKECKILNSNYLKQKSPILYHFNQLDIGEIGFQCRFRIEI